MIGNSGLGGNFPQISRMAQVGGPKSLFHSMREQALILDKTIMPGYGVLRAGTCMAVATISGNLVPYPAVAATNTIGKTFLSITKASSGTTFYISNDHYDRWEAARADGEHLIVMADSITPEDLGVIASVTKNDQPGLTKVMGTASSTTATFTLANNACIYVQTAAADPFAASAYILDTDTDTGTGSEGFSKGALGSVVISNAILYLATLTSCNYDAAAATDMSAVTDGRYLILK